MFGNIICPGLTSSVVRNPAWLTQELKKILPTQIVGLYVGEDVVIDGSNNVTSWPGRIGPNLIPTNTNYFQSIKTDRKGVTGAYADKAFKLASATDNIRDVFTVVEPVTVPSTGDHALFFWAGSFSYQVSNAASTFDNSAYVEFTDGIQTLTLGEANKRHVYEWINENIPYASFNWLGALTGAPSLSWNQPAYFLMLIKDTAVNTLQRLQIQYVLDQYYRPDRAMASKLALDLYQLFGNSILQLSILDDAVLSGTNVESIPSRIGPVWTPYSTGRFSTRLVNGRRTMYAPDVTVSRVMQSAIILPNPVNTLIVAASPTLPLSTYSTLFMPLNGPSAGHGCFVGNSGSSNWYTAEGGTRYTDGISSDAISTVNGLHILQCTVANTSVVPSQWGGDQNNIDRSWTADMGMIVQFTNDFTIAQIYSGCNKLIKGYYSL